MQVSSHYYQNLSYFLIHPIIGWQAFLFIYLYYIIIAVNINSMSYYNPVSSYECLKPFAKAKASWGFQNLLWKN